MLALVITLIIAGGLALHVLLSVQIAEGEYQVHLLREKVQRIERDNSEIVYQIAMRSSLIQIEQAAAKQGFGPATGRVYVHRPQAQGNAVPGLLPQTLDMSGNTELGPSSSGIDRRQGAGAGDRSTGVPGLVGAGRPVVAVNPAIRSSRR